MVCSTCKGCDKEIRDKQRRYLKLGEHVLECLFYDQDVRYRILSESSALQKEKGLYNLVNANQRHKRPGYFSMESPSRKHHRMAGSLEREKNLLLRRC